MTLPTKKFTSGWRLAIGTCMAILVLLAGGVAAGDKDDTPKPATSGGPQKPDEKDGEKDEQVKLPPETMRKYGVRTGVAKKRKLVTHLSAPARLAFNTETMAVVGAAVQGRVAELKVRAGDVVKKDDELLVIESPELGEAQSDFLQKRTGLSAAEAAVEPTKDAYARAKTLYDQSQGISLTELQKREVESRTAQTTVLTAQAAVAAADNRLTLMGMNREAIGELTKTSKINPRYAVRAPLGGTVIERAITLGELVKPDLVKLLVIADTANLWVLVDVPEARLREIAIGSKATVSVAAVGDRTIDGTISYIASSVDPATRSVQVRIEVKADAPLRAGMFAQADITGVNGDGDELVLAVPDGAVQTVHGSTAVFVPVKGEENAFAVRLVSTGTTVGGWVTIVSGLDDGERIVTAGTFILKADVMKASAKDED